MANGATLVTGEVTGIAKSRNDSRVSGIELADGNSIACDALVLAMGPWSLLAARWLPLPPIYGLKGHSVIFRPDVPLPAEAIFAQYEDDDGEVFAPEIVPRADGTLYVCGLSGHAAMPVDPARVVPEDGGCEKLREITIGLVPALAGAEVIAEQACYRPVTEDGLPVVGAIPGIEAAYVATGHSVWGMLNAPATGEAISELVLEGAARTVDLAPFAPSRMAALDPANLELRPG